MKEDKSKISRRNFFKKGAIITGGIAVASAFTPFDAVLFATERPKERVNGMASASTLTNA